MGVYRIDNILHSLGNDQFDYGNFQEGFDDPPQNNQKIPQSLRILDFLLLLLLLWKKSQALSDIYGTHRITV